MKLALLCRGDSAENEDGNDATDNLVPSDLFYNLQQGANNAIPL